MAVKKEKPSLMQLSNEFEQAGARYLNALLDERDNLQERLERIGYQCEAIVTAIPALREEEE